MKKVFKARIKWLSKEQGGRESLPIGDKYGPQILLKGENLSSMKNAWSLIVKNNEVISNLETIADVWYLVDKAPNNLAKGVEFSLFEGARLIATGIIL